MGHNKLDNGKFIERCKEIHGESTYDYSLVEYNGFKENIKIICKEHGLFNQRAQLHLNGAKCMNCYKESRNISHDEFIERCYKIHNFKYDYSNTFFTSSKKKVDIICSIHGNFKQPSYIHLKGSGCPKCARVSHRISQSDFIKRSIVVHNNLYDYSLVKYINHSTKVKIICKEHGEFNQTPNNHMIHKKGCSKCNGGVKYSIDEFIEKSNHIHKNKYDYSQVKYIDASYKVEILCESHGLFNQTPVAHMIGQGCPICFIESQKMNIDEFIEKSNDIHKNKYDYSLVKYKGSKTKVDIICKCGFKFSQKPSNHLSGQGCPNCSSSSISKMESKWLDSINVLDQYKHKSLRINNKLFFVDAFDPIKNIIYEFYGDYWHGNPNIYKSEDLNKSSKVKFGDLYNRTIKRENVLKENGYTIVYIWESDFKNNNNKI